MSSRAVAASLLLFLAARPIQGQVAAVEGPLPPQVLQEVLDILNGPDVLRLSGAARVPAGSRIDGDVAVLAGSIQVAGTVAGSLLVVNGDLGLSPSARVEGNVLVVGGALSGEDQAAVIGAVRVYATPLSYRVQEGRIEARPDDALPSGFLLADLGFGQARLGLRAAAAYNRVEGLPVHVGPMIRTGGSNPLSLETFAIWRSVSGLHVKSEELGYWFRLRQAVGGGGNLFIGAEAWDDTSPIEDQGLGDLEASLSTFLLRRDVRDHYDRRGWAAFFEVRPARAPLQAMFTYSYEEHDTAPVRGPWALREGVEEWSPMPLAATGPLRSAGASLSWNSQNDPVQPSDGWLLSLEVTRQVGGELRLPPSAPAPPEGGSSPPLVEGDPIPRFTRGAIDVRRYARVGPTVRLILRAAATGNLSDGPLPPQLQTALGGEGSLPGHRRYAIDCGAREDRYVASSADADGGTGRVEVLPAYGCDRTVLFQAEVQGFLPFSWRPLPAEWEGSELATLLDLRPVWSVFFDAGRGWSRGSILSGLARVDSPTRADVGVGLFVGPLGLYWSYPLNQRDRGLNFFVRLEQRL